MTKLSISLAAALLSVTYAPTAGAYSFEPANAPVTVAAVSAPQVADAEGVCAVDVTPLLASILALPDHVTDAGNRAAETALACVEED